MWLEIYGALIDGNNNCFSCFGFFCEASVKTEFFPFLLFGYLYFAFSMDGIVNLATLNFDSLVYLFLI